MAAEIVQGGDTLANAEMFDFRPDFDDRARGLVADNVRPGGQLTAEPAERVTAFDGDGLDLNDHALGVDSWVWNVLVFQDLGATILVVDCGFHGFLQRLNSCLEDDLSRPWFPGKPKVGIAEGSADTRDS